MSAKSSIRTDGAFAQFYALTADVRSVVAMYRSAAGCSYGEAWAAWFAWALGSGEVSQQSQPVN